MKAKVSIGIIGALVALGLLVAGCGGSSTMTEESVSAPSTGAPADSTSGGAVPSEAESAATGDIPDNQTFLSFDDPAAGYSIRYPEGWARKGSGNDVTFSEKGNQIHLVVSAGPPPSEATAVSGVEKLRRSDATIKGQSPEELTLGGQPAVKIVYTRESEPDPVTGKRLPLIIDRYEYGHGGRVAILDMATPEGVDNVDAYRLISESFKWR